MLKNALSPYVKETKHWIVSLSWLIPHHFTKFHGILPSSHLAHHATHDWNRKPLRWWWKKLGLFLWHHFDSVIRPNPVLSIVLNVSVQRIREWDRGSRLLASSALSHSALLTLLHTPLGRNTYLNTSLHQSPYSLSFSHIPTPPPPAPIPDTTEGIHSSWFFNISHILGLLWPRWSVICVIDVFPTLHLVLIRISSPQPEPAETGVPSLLFFPSVAFSLSPLSCTFPHTSTLPCVMSLKTYMWEAPLSSEKVSGVRKKQEELPW